MKKIKKSSKGSLKTSKKNPRNLIALENHSRPEQSTNLVVQDPLQMYMREVTRIPLLDEEETKKLSEKLFYDGDLNAAKKLVQANLRLVVKIALEYRGLYPSVMDLIQEGNMGLMKAVSKYDPQRNVKLSYYSAMWIKSYILKFILDNFNLVKIGSGKVQKKLFFNLMKEQNKLKLMGNFSEEKSNQMIAQNLGINENKVRDMAARLGSKREVSISPDENEKEIVIMDQKESVLDLLEHENQIEILNNAIEQSSFTPNEQVVFSERLMSDQPKTLQEIADQIHVSRERARQLEEQVIKKLKKTVDKQIEYKIKSLPTQKPSHPVRSHSKKKKKKLSDKNA